MSVDLTRRREPKSHLRRSCQSGIATKGALSVATLSWRVDCTLWSRCVARSRSDVVLLETTESQPKPIQEVEPGGFSDDRQRCQMFGSRAVEHERGDCAQSPSVGDGSSRMTLSTASLIRNRTLGRLSSSATFTV